MHDHSQASSSQVSSQWLTNKYGYFDTRAHEFVITRPDTPAPWINYITNGKYTGLISNTAGGYSFYLSPRDGRITRWRYNSLPPDRPGRYLYIRDNADGRYWSPTWQPTFTPLTSYVCRHGLHYTIIESSYRDIRSRLTYFIPDDDLEIWKVELVNTGNTTKELSLYAYVELCLGHALVDLINQPNDQHFNTVRFLADDEILLATKRYWVTFDRATVRQSNQAWNRWAFMASGLPVDGFDGSRAQFIGRWRSEQNPRAIELGTIYNSAITAGDAVAAIKIPVVLKPGEELIFPILLGVVGCEHPERDARNLVGKYRRLDTVEAAFTRLKEEMDDYLSAVQVSVPDPEMQLMLNCWNQYQAKVAFQCSRNASYHHGGLLFGRGFRDSCQDSLGPLLTRPAWVRDRIFEMAQQQFKSGETFHCYYPTSGGGEQTGHSDTALWLPFVACMYVKETGDFEILKRLVPYVDGGNASLMKHLLGALHYSLTRLSPRKLLLFGPGDWNDTLDYLGREGKGETVWGSMFLCYVLREMIELLGQCKHPQTTHYQHRYDQIKSAINRYCWDGRWYIRGTNDAGARIGSVKCKEGKIFLNTQSWAIMSAVAEGNRVAQCLDSVAQHLSTSKGPKILHPPYATINPQIGLVTRCVPGKKENGAVFNHAAAWAMLADLMAGRAEQAYEIYRQMLPMNPEIDIDRYEVEPYVYAEYVTSPDHPTYGQASHSWLTGSSVWMLRIALDYLLGVRPAYDGLVVDPCIPRNWDGYTVKRTFRGASYEISVSNPHHVNRGVQSLACNGQILEKPMIPIMADGKIHKVNAILGPLS